MKWWADWLVDNPRDHARCPGLTLLHSCEGANKAPHSTPLCRKAWESLASRYSLTYKEHVPLPLGHFVDETIDLHPFSISSKSTTRTIASISSKPVTDGPHLISTRCSHSQEAHAESWLQHSQMIKSTPTPLRRWSSAAKSVHMLGNFFLTICRSAFSVDLAGINDEADVLSDKVFDWSTSPFPPQYGTAFQQPQGPTARPQTHSINQNNIHQYDHALLSTSTFELGVPPAYYATDASNGDFPGDYGNHQGCQNLTAASQFVDGFTYLFDSNLGGTDAALQILYARSLVPTQHALDQPDVLKTPLRDVSYMNTSSHAAPLEPNGLNAHYDKISGSVDSENPHCFQGQTGYDFQGQTGCEFSLDDAHLLPIFSHPMHYQAATWPDANLGFNQYPQLAFQPTMTGIAPLATPQPAVVVVPQPAPCVTKSSAALATTAATCSSTAHRSSIAQS